MESLFNSEVKIEVFEAMKRGDFSLMDKLAAEFHPYMKSRYGKRFEEGKIEDFQDFTQQCSIEIIESAPSFRGHSIGQLCKFTTTIIDRTAKSMLNEYITYRENHVCIKSSHEEYYYSQIAGPDNGFEEQILNKIWDSEIYHKFIKGKISKSEQKVMEVLILCGGDIDAAVKKIDIKLSTFRRTLSRAKESIAEIIISEEFKKFHVHLIITLSVLSQGIIADYIPLLDNFYIKACITVALL